MQFDSQGWLDAAQEIDYTSKSMSREGYSINYVLIHGTAGGSSAENIGNYFASSDVQASAHIVIDQAGKIVQGIPLSLAAWANGPISGTPANLGFRTTGDGVHRDAWWNDNVNPNWISASIEFVKSSTDNSDQLTDIQAQVGFEVIKCICDTYNIPKHFADSSGGITGHFSMDPVNRSRCPGPWPWDGLWSYLSGNEEETMSIDINTPGVSQFFKASVGDKTWLCTNGKIVGGAILDFYKSFGGSGLCGLSFLGLPQSGEIGVAGHPGVTVQEFERGTLRYDPSHLVDAPPGVGSVYLIHIEQDPRTIAAQTQIAALQKQIAALQPGALAQELAALQAKIAQVVKDLS